MKKFINKNKFIIALLLITFLLRLPSLFEPYWYGDEGVYLTLGAAINKGMLLYRDIFDNKPPLIYLLAAAAGGRLFWFRFFLTVSSLASLYLFYRLSQKLFDSQKLPVAAASIVFAFLTTGRFLEGNIANAENFILLPTLAGLNLVFSGSKAEKGQLRFLAAGLILSLGFLLKVPAVFDFLALVVFLIFFSHSPKLRLFDRKLVLGLGYTIPLLLTGLFFFFKGEIKTFWDSCFVQMFGYLSSWEKGSSAFSWDTILKSEIVLRTGVVLALGTFLWFRRKSLSKTVCFIFLWFIFSLLAATLSGRPYPHYLIQIIPPFSLSLGFFFRKENKLNLLVLLAPIFLLVLAFWHYRFWYYPTVPYYRNFLEFISGRKNKEAYFAYFQPGLPQLYRLAEFIKAVTKPGERIFIWGNEPYLYPLSQRLPITLFTVAYHVVDLNEFDRTISLLKTQKPVLVVFDRQAPEFPQLRVLLKDEYFKVHGFDRLDVFIKGLTDE